jgi:hypothetical protein
MTLVCRSSSSNRLTLGGDLSLIEAEIINEAAGPGVPENKRKENKIKPLSFEVL